MSLNQDELKEQLAKLGTQARGFRRRLAFAIALHPNTATGYVLVTLPFVLYGVAKLAAWVW